MVTWRTIHAFTTHCALDLESRSNAHFGRSIFQSLFSFRTLSPFLDTAFQISPRVAICKGNFKKCRLVICSWSSLIYFPHSHIPHLSSLLLWNPNCIITWYSALAFILQCVLCQEEKGEDQMLLTGTVTRRFHHSSCIKSAHPKSVNYAACIMKNFSYK